MSNFKKRLKFYLHILPVLTILVLFPFALYAPQPSRIIMIGLDAADWDILNPMLDAGRLPNIRRIVDGGVTSKIETFEPAISPTVWTTISTGVTRKTHGIEGFVIPGTNTPYNSSMRKVPAIWNILSHYDRHVGIVGHWASWPSEKINGEMVSSYISYDPAEGARLYYKGKLRKEVNIPDQTYPPGLIDELQPYIVTDKDITREDLKRFFNIDDWNDPDLYVKELGEALTYIIPWTHAADKTHFDVFDYLRHNKGPYDLIFTYIEGTDVFGHRFWQFYNTEYLDKTMEHWGYDLSKRDKYIRAFGDSINRYYEWADERVGNVMDEMGPRDTLIVLSDHGFGPFRSGAGYSEEDERHTFSGDHAHFGVIMFYGANVKKGYRIQGPPPKLTDVVPTVLTLMKLPMAQYLEGHVIWDAISPHFAATYREQWIRSYGIEQQFGKQTKENPLDWELVRRMKSLGYLQ